MAQCETILFSRGKRSGRIFKNKNNNNNLFKISALPKCFSVGSCKNYARYNTIRYDTIR